MSGRHRAVRFLAAVLVGGSSLIAHLNISIGRSMDTPMPMHLRPPSTSKSEERRFEEDLKWHRSFDREGKRITGKLWAGEVYHDYRTRMPTDPITGEPTKPRPRPEEPVAEDPRRQLQDGEALGVIGSSLSLATTPY